MVGYYHCLHFIELVKAQRETCPILPKALWLIRVKVSYLTPNSMFLESIFLSGICMEDDLLGLIEKSVGQRS